MCYKIIAETKYEMISILIVLTVMIVIIDVFMQITNILHEEGGLDLITGDAGSVPMGGLPKMVGLFLKGGA